MNRAWIAVPVVVAAGALAASRFYPTPDPPTVAALKFDHAATRLRDINIEIALLKSPSVVIVGDSLTEEALWPETVCGRKVVNGGIGTADTARADSLVVDFHWLHYQPEVIVIATGMNDAHKGQWNEASFRHSYQAIVNEALTVTTNVMVATLTPVDYGAEVGKVIDPKGREAINRAIRDIAADHHLPVIDTEALQAPTRDGVHHTPEGSKLFAGRIVGAIGQKMGCAGY